MSEGFYVADDGSGIPSEKRDAVLDDGYTTTDGEGGLGLAIVQRIVEAHGWDIDVTESDGGGTRFEITDITRTDSSEKDTYTRSKTPIQLTGRRGHCLRLSSSCDSSDVLARSGTHRSVAGRQRRDLEPNDGAGSPFLGEVTCCGEPSDVPRPAIRRTRRHFKREPHHASSANAAGRPVIDISGVCFDGCDRRPPVGPAVGVGQDIPHGVDRRIDVVPDDQPSPVRCFLDRNTARAEFECHYQKQ